MPASTLLLSNLPKYLHTVVHKKQQQQKKKQCLRAGKNVKPSPVRVSQLSNFTHSEKITLMTNF